MAGTTIADDGSVMAAFHVAMERFGIGPGARGYERANRVVHETMGQSKIEVIRRILHDEADAQEANSLFEISYAESVNAGAVVPVHGAAETLVALRATSSTPSPACSRSSASATDGRPAWRWQHRRPGAAGRTRSGLATMFLRCRRCSSSETTLLSRGGC